MRILVLAGGNSAEREVSLLSGKAVANALIERGHDVTVLDPCEVDVAALASDQWDISIPMVHGTGGEDGFLQRQLNSAGIRWVGSSEEASALTFDKHRTNTLLAHHGLTVPAGVVLCHGDQLTNLEDQIETLGPLWVTKPVCQGSSIGVSIVPVFNKLSAAVDLALQHDDRCLIEAYIAGREATVTVVNGTALPSIEIVATEWYDYETKYEDNPTEYRFGSNDKSGRHGALAVKACELCGVSGIARVDMRIDGADRPWILEINTIPGMTSHSLVPKAARQAGQTLAELLEAAIDVALQE